MRNKFYAAAWRVLRPLVLFFLPVDLRGTEHLEGGEPAHIPEPTRKRYRRS